nr:MAG TPA: hypothetical protein [Herelleviridae sp.]
MALFYLKLGTLNLFYFLIGVRHTLVHYSLQ